MRSARTTGPLTPWRAPEATSRRCNGNRRGRLSQAVDRFGNGSEIGRSFRCRIDDLSVSDVEFLRKVEGMQDDMARFVK